MMAGDEVRPLGAAAGTTGAMMAGDVCGRLEPGAPCGGGTARAPGAPGGGGTLGAPDGTGTREAGAPGGAGTPGTRWLTGVRLGVWLAGIAFVTRGTDGAIDGATAGAIDGATAGAIDGATAGGIDGATAGAMDGAIDGGRTGAMVGVTAGRACVGGRTCGTGGRPGGLPCWSSGGAISVSQLRPVTEGPGGWPAAFLRCPSWTSECRSRRGLTTG